MALAAIEIREPLPGTPLDDPAWETYWADLAERTGGTDDKVETASTTAAQGVADAAAAASAASTAQDTATNASASVTVNRAILDRVRFASGYL